MARVQLSPEEIAAIQRYIVRFLAPGGLVFVLLAGAAGYYLRNVADAMAAAKASTAEATALERAVEHIIKATQDAADGSARAGVAAAQAEAARESAVAATKAATEIVARIQEVEKLADALKTSDTVAAALAADEVFVGKVKAVVASRDDISCRSLTIVGPGEAPAVRVGSAQNGNGIVSIFRAGGTMVVEAGVHGTTLDGYVQVTDMHRHDIKVLTPKGVQ